MGKYDPLRDHLKHQDRDDFTVTFAVIERILGEPLPLAALKAEWWASKTPEGQKHVQADAWRKVGFEAFLLPGAVKRVRFMRKR